MWEVLVNNIHKKHLGEIQSAFFVYIFRFSAGEQVPVLDALEKL